MMTWIQQNFDSAFYLEANPDVRQAGMDPWSHFRDFGHSEGRLSNPSLQQIGPALLARSKISKTPLADMVSLFPAAERDAVLKGETWDRLAKIFQPKFYAAQTGDPNHISGELGLIHYLTNGAFSGLRPTILFNSEAYKRNLALRDRRALVSSNMEAEPSFFHWLTFGWRNRIVPTPLFDEQFYLESHQDLTRWKGWLFEHYIIYGCREAHRRASPFVDAINPATIEGGIPIVERVLREAERNSIPALDLSERTSIEDVANDMLEKLQSLEKPKYADLVEKAAAIEPLILRPYSARVVQWPPIRHALTEVMEIVEEIRGTIGCTSTDTIMLIPHCRMAGSARVAGYLTRALAKIDPDKRLLVITTDLHDFDQPEWFAESTRVFDVSQHTQHLSMENKVRVLLDVVRGLRAEKIINVNSRLGWELFDVFGPQLSMSHNLYAYLFTWDLDIRGNKGGYPITFFQTCFGFMTGVFVDNSALKHELESRYALSSELRRRLHVLFTPSEPTLNDFSDVFERRRNARKPLFSLRKPRLQAIWAGRFDRQKRFDLVVEIARRMPDLDILAWGKEVLGHSGVDFLNLPENIKLMGTYNVLSELPFSNSDFFLYTSEWDGLPTILIDIGSQGMPVVASHTGGLGDLITRETAFPVHDVMNPDAYVSEIRQMQLEPNEVTKRAARLRKLTTIKCNKEVYEKSLAAGLHL